MSEYRKKMIIVEAVQYLGDRWNEHAPHWVTEALGSGVLSKDSSGNLIVKTLEGDMMLAPGNWLMKGVADELYPCKDEIFKVSYERAPPAPRSSVRIIRDPGPRHPGPKRHHGGRDK